MSSFPTQSQLVLPLLETLRDAGGRMKGADAAQALANRMDVPQRDRQTKTFAGEAAGDVNAWGRHVRWARQKAVLEGLVHSPEHGVWELTEKGADTLQNIRPGLVVTVFETAAGVALWAECEAALGHIDNGILNLIMTSPPYPLLKKKAYAGQLDSASYLDWLTDLAAGWYEKLADDGSLVLNLGDVWEPGRPTLDLYQERLLVRLVDQAGFHLAQRFVWENPSKMPSPAQWVTVNRVRVTPSVEMVWHLSKTPHPKTNNRNVLRPYSEAMRRRLGEGGETAARRPSGHTLADGAFARDNGGSIPHNLIVAANTRSNDGYQVACRRAGVTPHPARFPRELPEFFIRYTTDEGDIVMDPFGGSGQTAAVAEELGRRWILSEKSLEYLRGAQFRFEQAAGFQRRLRELQVA